MPKLTQLASILNGEIPVVLIYIEKDQPKRYELANPGSPAMLAVIEVMNKKSQRRKV